MNSKESPLLCVPPSQVNFQFPPDTPVGSVAVGMIVDNVVSNVLKVQIARTAHTLFNVVLVSAFQKKLPARSGEYIMLFATGLSSSTVPSGAVTASVGSLPATVAFADAAPPGLNPYAAGPYQIDILVPDSILPGDAVPVTITSQGAQSNTLNIPVASGRSVSIARFLELGPEGVVARAITSQSNCPAMTVDWSVQTMTARAAPTLPLYRF